MVRTAEEREPEPRPADRNSLLIALVVSFANFMQALDGTVIATAIPQIARSFGVSAVDLSLGITAYLMTVAIFSPVSSWIADRFGARTVFASAIALFTLASALCGASHGLWPFVAARALQGTAGAMMLPVGQLILLRGTAKKDLVRAITLATTPGLVAPVIGPPIGGFITTFAGWPWIFYLNLPIGAVGLFCILRFLPNPKAEERQPFDSMGLVLNGSAVGLLIYGMSRLGAPGESWGVAGGLTVAGLLLGAVAVRHAQRNPYPMLPLTPLRFPSFTTTVLTAGTALRLQVRIIPFVLPLLFQLGFGMTAFQSGLVFLAHTGGDVLLKTVTTQILRAWGFRRTFLVFTILFAVSIACFSLFTAATPYWVMFLVLAVSGGFRSPLFTGLSTLTYAEMPQKEIGSATALANVIQQVTGALGVSLAALMLNLSVALRHGGSADPTILDYRITLLMSSLIAFLALIPFGRLPHDVGAEVSGHRPTPKPAR